jgi:large subunit ribosomal protein L24
VATSKIKKGDTVRVIAGEDKGKEGKVLEVKNGRVKVEGVNKVKIHVKPNQSNAKGGIVEEEAFMDISNVMYVLDGKVTRIGFKTEDGKDKARYAKKTGAVIE